MGWLELGRLHLLLIECLNLEQLGILRPKSRANYIMSWWTCKWYLSSGNQDSARSKCNGAPRARDVAKRAWINFHTSEWRTGLSPNSCSSLLPPLRPATSSFQIDRWLLRGFSGFSRWCCIFITMVCLQDYGTSNLSDREDQAGGVSIQHNFEIGSELSSHLKWLYQIRIGLKVLLNGIFNVEERIVIQNLMFK